MALAIDGSTPAVVTQATGSTATIATASFTPPSGSTLLVLYSANTVDPNDPGNPTITDSLGGHLTYTSWDIGKRPDTPAAEGQVATWTAPVVTGAAMTVTVTNGAASPNRHAALCVIVLTGAAATPVGAHGKASSLSAGSIAQSFTGTAASSLGFMTVCDWFDAGAETAGTGCTLLGSADIAGNFTYGFFRRTTADGTSGGGTTMNATLPGTSTSLRWAWVEIVPAAAVGGSVGTVFAPPPGRPRPLAGSAVTLDHGVIIQSPAPDVPYVQVQPSAGLPRRANGNVVMLAPRAEPSPLQNQPVVVPVVAYGRPAAPAGQAWLAAPRAEPAGNTPPVEAPVVSAGRPAPPSGSVWTLSPRAEPSAAQNQPMPAALVAVAAARAPAGTAVLTVVRGPAEQPAEQSVVVAGRYALPSAGAAWTTTPRADTAADSPTPPVVVAARSTPPRGSVQILGVRSDPAAGDATPRLLVVAARLPAPAGAAVALAMPGQDVYGRPAVVVAAGTRPAAAAAPAVLRSAFTVLPDVLRPILLVPGLRLAVRGSVVFRRPVSLPVVFGPDLLLVLGDPEPRWVAATIDGRWTADPPDPRWAGGDPDGRWLLDQIDTRWLDGPEEV